MILYSTMKMPSSSYQHRIRDLLVLLGCFVLLATLWPGTAAAVPKTDVITLISGDVITCEIKEMVRGKVRAKTDHMGTLSIEWDKITEISSHYWFLITNRGGRVFYGQLSETIEAGYLEVVFQDQSTMLPMNSVVEIQPVRYDLWDRFDMSASFGFSWSKGSDVFQGNFDAGVKYNGQTYSYGLDASAMLTDQSEEGVTRRNQTDLFLAREISGRLVGTVQGGTFRNDELGVRMRVSSGLNLGYYFLRLKQLELRGQIGANVNREWASDYSDPTNNAEGRLGVDFTLFYYDTPKSDISVKADAYPSFTVTDRIRFEGDISARQEIVSDLFIKLSYYESRDTKPPTGDESSSDRGIVFAIEWTK